MASQERPSIGLGWLVVSCIDPDREFRLPINGLDDRNVF